MSQEILAFLRSDRDRVKMESGALSKHYREHKEALRQEHLDCPVILFIHEAQVTVLFGTLNESPGEFFHRMNQACPAFQAAEHCLLKTLKTRQSPAWSRDQIVKVRDLKQRKQQLKDNRQASVYLELARLYNARDRELISKANRYYSKAIELGSRLAALELVIRVCVFGEFRLMWRLIQLFILKSLV